MRCTQHLRRVIEMVRNADQVVPASCDRNTDDHTIQAQQAQRSQFSRQVIIIQDYKITDQSTKIVKSKNSTALGCTLK